MGRVVMLVLDTSALIFWTLDRDRLSVDAGKAIGEADQIAISSISIWEIGIKVKNQKLEIPISLQEYVDRLGGVDRFEIIAVDAHTWVKNIALDWTHRDPADRTIVATASLLGSPLVSSDAKIRAFYAPTIW